MKVAFDLMTDRDKAVLSALTMAICLGISGVANSEDARGFSFPEPVSVVLESTCTGCHSEENAEGGLNIGGISTDLADAGVRARWVKIFDRVRTGEMPPDADDLPKDQRELFVTSLRGPLLEADLADVADHGRGPMRRLNRDEYQQNLRDVLQLPLLDIRDMLPQDREAFHFNKSTEVLDLSRVQLTAYLNAAEEALHQAVAVAVQPPVPAKYRAVGRNLFAETWTFGNREAMFFARDSKGLSDEQLKELRDDETVELAIFRSAHWPYYGYPVGFVAQKAGEYRVRFTGRAVVQLPGFILQPATRPVPMTFRARKPSGPDVSGDVRATGGLIDLQPEVATYETTVLLKVGETIEYSLLGLPVPLARNVNGGEPTYRYPPFPKDGQPGGAFQLLEIEGPLTPAEWPPASHRVLFDELPIGPGSGSDGLAVEVISENPAADASRLLRRFIAQAARAPVPEDSIQKFEQLVLSQLDRGESLTQALLTGYQAFLCSSHMLYLQEPVGQEDQFAIANRLSHFLANTRPDPQLMQLAREHRLRECDTLCAEADRLIGSPEFERFIHSFTDYWLNLRHLQRDEPNVQLHPEYRFDNYLVESMERETQAFFTAMFRENLPANVLIDSDFTFVNDRLTRHYGFPDVDGSAMRKVTIPDGSPYGGLLTQAAILKVTANGTTTSPVVRGAWIMDRLIGQPPPPPPAKVPAVEPDIRGAKTIRGLLSLHTKSAACAGCHAKFDPVGLALENFDILGAWQTRYRGLGEGEQVTGIDRAGHDFAYVLTAPVEAGGKLLSGEQFSDIHELKKLFLADHRPLARNLLQQFTVYSTGTPVRFSDRDEIERILDDCAPNDYRVGDLLRGLITSRIFLGQPGCQAKKDD
ncbi:DUF1592 domain-containing protein [Planctomicrobium sp. SH661]|uniref:DUF1592 domain-containing protein n=1 Tax=Planctomicrobium sp. SH661 TaxID=3448124 RepID=UPI003F5B7710